MKTKPESQIMNRLLFLVGYEKVVRLLIQYSVSINAVDKDGHTALDAAADATECKLKKKIIVFGMRLTMNDSNFCSTSRSDQFVESTWSSL